MLFILHQVNCQDAFGSGFAGYLNRVFPTAKTRYHEFIRQMREAGFTKDTDLLGQAVEAVGDGFTIVHCFGQRYYGNSRNTGRCYTDYNAVEQALARFRKRHPHDTAICPQYMGCGLAGGDWERYSAILAKYNIIPCINIDLINRTFQRALPKPNSIKKMEFRGEYWFLSNFYPCKIYYKGLEFDCVESAFQAAKCKDPVDRKRFVGLNGAEAKKLGRKIKMRDDWNMNLSGDYKVKDNIMESLINQKFGKYPDLLRRLREISEPIVENNTWNDTYWGVCNGKGLNKLGKILENVKVNCHPDSDIDGEPDNNLPNYKFIKVSGKYVRKASK